MDDELATRLVGKFKIAKKLFLTIKGAMKLSPKIVFVFATKIGEDATKILNCYFSKQIYPLAHQTKYLKMWKSKFTSNKQYLCCLLFSRNVKTNIQTKVYYIFLYPLWKETTHKPSNVVAATNLFSSVYVIGITCFDECFSFCVITGRHYFL